MLKKSLLSIAALIVCLSAFYACGSESTPKDTVSSDSTSAAAETTTAETTTAETTTAETTTAETTTAETTTAETTTAETTTAETTAAAIVIPAFPQGEIPCNLNDAYDLSDDILVSDFNLVDNGGQWVLGDDSYQMDNYLTAELLGKYKYFTISYTCDDTDADSAMALMLKYQHEDGTKTEYLCDQWQAYGPAGMTFQASDFATTPIYSEGVFYIPTEAFITNENFVEGDIINQIGLAALEGSGTNVNISVTGAALCN